VTALVYRIMALRNTHILVPRAYVYVTLHGRRDFADVIKDLEMGRLSLMIIIANAFTKIY